MDFLKILLNLFGVGNDSADNIQRSAEPMRQASPSQSYAQPAEEPQRSAAEWEAFFRTILKSEFPAYSIREKVPVTDLVGFASDQFQLYATRPTQAYKAEWGQPYTFVLEANGQPKAVVMLGNGHSHDSNVKYLIARMYAKKLNIPYINFYTQMPNERSYVVGRIRKFLE